MPSPNLNTKDIDVVKKQFKAWMQGALARTSNSLVLSDNPYPPRTIEGDAWENGWEQIDFCSDKPTEIKDILENGCWLETLESKKAYVRYEDDSRLGYIGVEFTQDGDGWIQVVSKPDKNDMHFIHRFRTDFGGGGQSPRVRNALMILAEAIRLDNEDRPQHRKVENDSP